MIKGKRYNTQPLFQTSQKMSVRKGALQPWWNPPRSWVLWIDDDRDGIYHCHCWKVGTILEDSYPFAMVVLLTMVMINVPQSLLSAEFLVLHKIMQFSNFPLNWVAILLQYKTSVQTWVMPKKMHVTYTKTHTKYHSKCGLSWINLGNGIDLKGL